MIRCPLFALLSTHSRCEYASFGFDLVLPLILNSIISSVVLFIRYVSTTPLPTVFLRSTFVALLAPPVVFGSGTLLLLPFRSPTAILVTTPSSWPPRFLFILTSAPLPLILSFTSAPSICHVGRGRHGGMLRPPLLIARQLRAVLGRAIHSCASRANVHTSIQVGDADMRVQPVADR